MIRKIHTITASWFFIGILVWSMMFAGLSWYFSVPDPYYNVELVEVYWQKNDLLLVANFMKDDACVFEKLEIYAKTSDGLWRTFDYYDSNAEDGQGESDRLHGAQTVYIGVKDIGNIRDNITAFEMRTRHNCRVHGDFVKNDKIFVSVDEDLIAEAKLQVTSNSHDDRWNGRLPEHSVSH